MVAKLLDQTNNIKGLLTGWGLSARPCDVCHAAAALLYCRADAAFLCGACDAKVHAANHLANIMARHERVWMCEVCEQAPAAVTCKADAAVLCTSCDHDIHSANPLARRHERVPVVPFLDSAADAALRSTLTTASSTFLTPSKPSVTIHAPVVAAAAAVEFDSSSNNDDDDSELLLIPNLNSTFLYNESYLLDCGVRDNLEKHSKREHQPQNYESLSFAMTDSVVPTQSSGNLSFSNTADHLFDASFEIDFSQPAKHHNKKIKANNKFNQQQFYSSFNFSAQHSVSSSEIGVVPESNTNSTSELPYTFSNSATSAAAGDIGTPATVGLDREARVLRYREKRKNRKFQKTIRYASRKAYAETRPRIKGRFAKRTGNNETTIADHMFDTDSGCGFGLEAEYGVVPTF